MLNLRYGSLVVSISVTVALAGCSLFTDKLKPTPAAVANGSFRDAVDAEKAQANQAPTLTEVKKAFSALYKGVRERTAEKTAQQWAYRETAAVGGFFATLGHLADKTGLLNVGLATASAGLGADAFYAPGQTVKTSLKAEELFTCFARELGKVSEADRAKAKRATSGAIEAANAVDDVIARVDSAISSYRRSILGQEGAIPGRADFERFAEAYRSKQQQSQAAQALAMRAETAGLAGLPDDEKQRRSARQDQAVLQAQAELDQSSADAAGAQFIKLATDLELCEKTYVL
jgi:hypothetical protein